MPKLTLENISETKRERIFQVAAGEFARLGFHGANVAAVAEKAGIAKGALYLYFESKLDLYRETLRNGAALLAGIFEDVEAAGGPVDLQLRALYARSARMVAEHPDLIRMYCDLSTGSEPQLTAMAAELEVDSAGFYRRLVAVGQQRGEVRRDVPAPLLALLLDTVFVNVFAAQVSGYQERRLQVFWPEAPDPVGALEGHVEEVLAFVTTGLAGSGAHGGAREETDDA